MCFRSGGSLVLPATSVTVTKLDFFSVCPPFAPSLLLESVSWIYDYAKEGDVTEKTFESYDDREREVASEAKYWEDHLALYPGVYRGALTGLKPPTYWHLRKSMPRTSSGMRYYPRTSKRSFKKYDKSTRAKRAVRRNPGMLRTTGFSSRFGGTQQEMKFHDVSNGGNTVSATGEILDLSLNLIANGTGESQRIGRKSVIRKIGVRYQMLLPAEASTASECSDVLRLIIYIDKQANGAAATVSQILSGTNFMDFNNLENKGRFTILMDKYHPISASNGFQTSSSAGTTGEAIRFHQWHKKVQVPISFNSTTGAITEICCNNIGVLGISQKGILAFSGEYRLRFTDS